MGGEVGVWGEFGEGLRGEGKGGRGLGLRVRVGGNRHSREVREACRLCCEQGETVIVSCGGLWSRDLSLPRYNYTKTRVNFQFPPNFCNFECPRDFLKN